MSASLAPFAPAVIRARHAVAPVVRRVLVAALGWLALTFAGLALMVGIGLASGSLAVAAESWTGESGAACVQLSLFVTDDASPLPAVFGAVCAPAVSVGAER